MRRTSLAIIGVFSITASLFVARAGTVDSSGVTLAARLSCSTGSGLQPCSITKGTHLEFMTREVDGVPHTFALQGSRDAATNTGWDVPGGGLNIIDITDPVTPIFVANVPCRTDNLDIATVYFPDAGRQPVVNGQAYDTIFALASNHEGIGCRVQPRGTLPPTPTIKGNSVQFAGIRAGASLVPGTSAVDFLGGGKSSPVYPVNPDGTKFVAWDSKFAHTVVAHPTRPVVYASNQALGDTEASVEIIDLAGTMITDKGVTNWHPVVRSMPAEPNGAGPHDITFSPDGTRAFVSSITTSAIWDVSGDNLFAPKMVTTLVAPGLKIHHEGTLSPDNRHLLVVDEFVATSSNGEVTATPQCPGGGVHVFDLGDARALEAAPTQVGIALANDTSIVGPATVDQNDPQGSATKNVAVGCTAHEYTIAPDGSWTPMAWMGAGLRIFDLSDLARADSLPAPTPVNVPEIGHYKEPGINIWAAKVRPEFPDYVFVSDEVQGFLVFKVDPSILPHAS